MRYADLLAALVSIVSVFSLAIIDIPMVCSMGLGGSPRLDALALRELGKSFHAAANFLARQAQLIKLLQVEPKLWARAEPVAEPQRRIGRDRALTVDDPSDSIHWHVDLARQFGGGHAEFLQLFGKMLAGVNRGACHGASSDNRQFRR